MNANQRRKSRRAWERKYPYLIRDVKFVMAAAAWCREHINPDEYWSPWHPAPEGVLWRSSGGFRFKHQKDAVHFALLWMGS